MCVLICQCVVGKLTHAAHAHLLNYLTFLRKCYNTSHRCILKIWRIQQKFIGSPWGSPPLKKHNSEHTVVGAEYSAKQAQCEPECVCVLSTVSCFEIAHLKHIVVNAEIQRQAGKM